MDFDTAKENIQPLRHGRRADRLEAALSEQSKDSLEHEKKQLEDAISNYVGEDPLSVWYEYICWIEQSYPKSGTESGLDEVVLKCIMEFEDNNKYKQDRRMVKLFIKYIDTQKDPHELYNHLYDGGVGTLVADLYIAWSYYFDTLNNYKQVEAIFRKGFDAGAQPLEELTQAHQSFSLSMSRRLLYDDEQSKQQFQAKMEEKRSALTSLRAHKKKFVGSLRTGNAVMDDNPGIVNQENLTANVKTKFEVHETADEQPGANALPANTSVIRNIIDSARKNENLHEPGPWRKAKLGGKCGKLFGKVEVLSQPDFAIMEDESFPPIPCPEKLFELGIKLPAGFVSRNKPQQSFNIPIVVSEPPVPNAFPCYEKFLLYPNSHSEISPEEYRGYKWYKDRNVTAKLTDQYDPIWTNTFETRIRIPPGFQMCNVKQVEKVEFERFLPGEEKEFLQVPHEKMYPENDEEVSLEELLAKKFKAGDIKLVVEEDFEEVDSNDNMDLTVIGERRQSIYPASRLSYLPRKSIMVRKSVMPPLTVEEENEEEEEEEEFKKPAAVFAIVPPQPTGAIRKSIIKRKFEESEERRSDDTEMRSAEKREFVSETPPRSSFNTFKPPAPVEKKATRVSINDYDDHNDSCSTQQFNLFIKAQSVSTPVRNTAARSAPAMSMPAYEEEIASNHQNTSSTPASTTQTQAQDNHLPKQLSTIMETTESTQSTKSSVSSANDTDFNPKTPKIIQMTRQVVTPQEVEQRLFNPLLASFRMPEDQTETCPKMNLPVVRMIPEFNASQAKHMTSMKALEVIEPQFEIFLDESLPLPPPCFDPEHSMKSAMSENSKLSSHQVTQIEIPETQPEQDFSAIDIPATQDFDIPATQDSEILVPQDFEASVESISLPTSQEFVEIQSSQKLEKTEEFEIAVTPALAPMLAPESIKTSAVVQPFNFNIYEDSIKENRQQLKPLVSDDEITGFLHASRKENFVEQQIKPMRTASDEFLALMASPQPVQQTSAALKHNSATRSSKAEQKNMSDLLKFSGVASAESSLNDLSIEAPKSSTPTIFRNNFIDDDLNTERFCLALGNLKNSTLIETNRQSPTLSALAPNDFNLSIAICDDEMARLAVKADEPRVDKTVPALFKIPQLPFAKPAAIKPVAQVQPTSFKIFEDYDDEDDCDLSKSIYKPRPQQCQEIEDDENEEFDPMCSFIATPANQYEHTMISEEHEMSLKVQQAIENSKGNPFCSKLRDTMLEHCNFSHYLETHVKTCSLLKQIPMLKEKSRIECSGTEFTVLKFLTKGAFGSIFTAKNSTNDKVYAMKQEKPANLWEYYICVELMDRLKDARMMPAFMKIDYAIIANNSSVLVTQFSPYGSIIDVCNKHKNATNKNVDEYVVMVLTTQLLSIIDHLHGCKIIHADVKPDNFLVMSKIEFGMKVPALQLIDFGSAIDLDCYNENPLFTYAVATENFICCEMQEHKPWTYHTDLYGLAGTSHVMLFGRYMEVEKKMLTWNVKTRLPRYFNKGLWDNFFNQLLNVQGCDAINMPNLQLLKDQFEEVIQIKQKFVCEKIAAFNQSLEN